MRVTWARNAAGASRLSEVDRVCYDRWAKRTTNQVLATGWRRLRAHGDAHFKEAIEEAAALHARGDLFAKHIKPEPAPEDPLDWAMAEQSDEDGDDTPPHADAEEPEVIDMPPAPASAPRMSNLERCIALRLVYGSGPR